MSNLLSYTFVRITQHISSKGKITSVNGAILNLKSWEPGYDFIK